MKKPDYKPEICDGSKKKGCHQTTTYILPIDRGTTDIVKAISVAIRKKGENSIHPRNEMEVQNKQLDYVTMTLEGLLTSIQVGNLSKARFHGLIARVAGQYGCYLLTPKGSRFLKGAAVPKYAVIKKGTEERKGTNIGYYNETTNLVTIHDFEHAEQYWEGFNYTVAGSRIVEDFKEIEQGVLAL